MYLPYTGQYQGDEWGPTVNAQYYPSDFSVNYEVINEPNNMSLEVILQQLINQNQQMMDQQNSFMAQTEQRISNLEYTLFGFAKQLEMMEEHLSKIVEHQAAQEEQCMTFELISEIPPEEPNADEEQCLISETPQEEFEVLNEEHGVENDEKSMKDEKFTISEDFKVFNIDDPYLDTNNGLKGCHFYFYLTPSFDFHTNSSNKRLPKYGGSLDRAIGDSDFQDVPMIAKAFYQWDSTDEALKFDEKWPPPTSSSCLVSSY